MVAKFRKLRDESWGLRVEGRPSVGDEILVPRRSGDPSLVRVTEVLEPSDGGFLCRFVDVDRDPPAPAAARPARGYSATSEQAAALEIFGRRAPLVIQAGAGTGKTSTLVMIAELAHGLGLRGQYVAFNSKIVADSAGKFPGSVECNTAHSLAFRAVGTQFGRRMQSGARMKSQEIARALRLEAIRVTKWDGEEKVLSPTFLAGLTMKSVIRFCQSADREIGPRHVPRVDNLDDPTPSGLHSYAVNREVAAALAPALRRAWADLCLFEGRLPFTKSTAMAVILKLWQLQSPHINADYILWDEAQDASPVMIDVIAQQSHAQVVWVGDSNQAIYGFTGAIDALDTVAGSAETAMLSQSFRFGPAIAEIANSVLATLPTTMRLVGTVEVPSRVVPVDSPDAILTRTNAAAIRAVMTALANEQRPFLVGSTGGEIARFCRAARDLQAGLLVDHPELGCFDNWGEVQEYVEHDEQGGDLRLMVSLIDEFGVDAILAAVDGCAKESDADVVVSTAHKSKGCEWGRVVIAGDFPEVAKMGDEERRLLYVAVTRARLELDITAVPFFAPAAPLGPQGAVAGLGEGNA